MNLNDKYWNGMTFPDFIVDKDTSQLTYGLVEHIFPAVRDSLYERHRKSGSPSNVKKVRLYFQPISVTSLANPDLNVKRLLILFISGETSAHVRKTDLALWAGQLWGRPLMISTPMFDITDAEHDSLTKQGLVCTELARQISRSPSYPDYF